MKFLYKILIPLVVVSIGGLSVFSFAQNMQNMQNEKAMSSIEEKLKRGRIMKLNPLTVEEKNIIIHKGTERP